MKKTLILAAFLVFQISGIFLIPLSAEDPVKILFIGSSYFKYNNLPELFRNLADHSEKEVEIDSYIPSGLFLSNHAASATTKLKIDSKDWDYVVLQGVGSLMAYPDSITDHPVYPAIQELKKKIVNNSPSTKVIFCMPWAFEDGMTWVEGWTDEFDDMQEKIYDRTIQYSRQLGFMIAPVGWAWYHVLEEKNYPLHYLHLSDWNHPTMEGSYLMACVLYSSIFLESTHGNPYDAGLSPVDAAYFQEIGSSIVLDTLQLWNIPLLPVGISNHSAVSTLQMPQNYPNPFSNSTSIEYTIPEAGQIELSVYNNYGNRVMELVNEYQFAGKYSLTFQPSALSEGIYYYSIQTGTEFLTRQMIFIY